MCCRKLEKCFFGWSLQTGTQAIGLATLFGVFEHFCKGLITLTMILSAAGDPIKDNVLILVNATAKIVASVIGMAITVPLLIAATKNSRPGLILPWLIVATIGLVALLGFPVWVGIVLSEFLGTVWTIGIICVALLLYILGYALAIYVWMVIFSYYKQLKKMEVQQNAAKQFPNLMDSNN